MAAVEVDAAAQEIRVHVEPRAGVSQVCPECGRRSSQYDRSEERRWRHLDTCQYRTVLVARIPRVDCVEHGVRQIKVPWAEDRSRFTVVFEAFAIRVLRETTLSGVSELLGVSWDEAEGIFRRAVARGLERREPEVVRAVGVDETSFQKRHEYVTVVADLERDRVLWVGDHRRQETLEAYWRTWTESEAKQLNTIVMDMWDPYIAATRNALPDGLSKIVFDRFHVMQQVTKAVDLVRRAEASQLQAQGDTRLQRTRYLWLKGLHRRSRRELLRIRELCRAGLKVGRAWAIKEALRKLWDFRSLTWALKFFKRWYGWATRSRLAPMITAARTLKRYLYGIIAYLRHPYTNALTESMNAKIQEIKYRARGYRNRNNFRLAILFHCGGLNMDPC